MKNEKCGKRINGVRMLDLAFFVLPFAFRRACRSIAGAFDRRYNLRHLTRLNKQSQFIGKGDDRGNSRGNQWLWPHWAFGVP
jgi:hypothetical protein